MLVRPPPRSACALDHARKELGVRRSPPAASPQARSGKPPRCRTPRASVRAPLPRETAALCEDMNRVRSPRSSPGHDLRRAASKPVMTSALVSTINSPASGSRHIAANRQPRLEPMRTLPVAPIALMSARPLDRATGSRSAITSGSPGNTPDPGEVIDLERDPRGAAKFCGDHAAHRYQLDLAIRRAGRAPGLVGGEQPAGAGLVAHTIMSRRTEFASPMYFADHAAIHVEPTAGPRTAPPARRSCPCRRRSRPEAAQLPPGQPQMRVLQWTMRA